MLEIQEVKNFFLNLQESLCDEFSEEDSGAEFITDPWQRSQGGGGITRVINNGNVFEKGGVNFSHVYGKGLPAQATERWPDLKGAPFQAIGVSVVMHPKNPYVPTSHANVRFFMAQKQDQTAVWWFGGGYDLTPYYGFEEDCVYWHSMAKKTCDAFELDAYARYKKWCDDYFYLPHRKEPRGIGGLFFDDLTGDFSRCFEFVKNVGRSYLTAYRHIVKKRKNLSYSQSQREFQLYRRGRYVEFNLLYDRGTKFGLHSGGRTESILMSLPSEVNWKYNWQPEKNSEEAKLYDVFLQPRDWI